MINISTNINMSRQQPVSSNKTVVKMKDVLRILNDPLDDSMRWITYYKIWFDWDKVVRRHGFSTSRKNFLHNLRTNYQWRQTCSCVNEDECPPNCRKGITEDFWMHDKLKNMEYASLMDIPKKKPGRNQPSPSITRYDLNSPPGTPPSNDEKLGGISPSSSNPSVQIPPAASTPILPPNIAAEMARTQQGPLIRSLLSSLQTLSATVQQNSRQIEKMRQTDRTFRKQAENEIVLLKQEVHNLKQQLVRTNSAIAFTALKPSFPNLLQNAQNMMQNGQQQQQFSIPPPPININTPQVKNEFMDFGNTIPPMFPYQAQQQQTTPVGSGHSSNQSTSSQQTHSASNTPSHSHQSVISPSGTSSSYSTQSTGPNTPIDPDSEMIEPMTSMTYGHEQGQNINPSSADLQLHDSFHDELGGIYRKQQQNLFEMSGISHHTR